LTVPFPIIELGTVTSTMTEARSRFISGRDRLPFAVLADAQTDGVGRLGRQWQSNVGTGLYVTFAIASTVEPARQGLIAIAAGLAVSDALAQIGVSSQLKWPNDVYVKTSKLAGILIQSVAGSPTCFLIGVGLNTVSDRIGDIPNAVALDNLTKHAPDRRSLTRSIGGRVMDRMAQLEKGRDLAIVQDWHSRALWIGEQVTIQSDSDLTGILIGISQTGALILETASGQRVLTVGDVVRGPRFSAPPYT
jgi:biotin-[acetyl-CoA-carboxylase] ligase BirA-like protein